VGAVDVGGVVVPVAPAVELVEVDVDEGGKLATLTL
jgi:hypothetical protein